MKRKIDIALRILLGAPMLLSGLNKFFMFLPQPEVAGRAGEFIGALAGSGYMMPMIALVEIVAGVLLLSGLFQPLALVALLPITLNIVLFHLFMAPEGTIIGLVFFGLNVYLAIPIWNSFRPMLAMKPAYRQ